MPSRWDCSSPAASTRRAQVKAWQIRWARCCRNWAHSRERLSPLWAPRTTRQLPELRRRNGDRGTGPSHSQRANANCSAGAYAGAHARESFDGDFGGCRRQEQRHPGEAAVILYVDQSKNFSVPQTVDGVRTEVIPTTHGSRRGHCAALSVSGLAIQQPLGTSLLTQAIASKQQVERSLMKQYPAFFGVGVGQSFDNPKEAALVIYVDRSMVPATLPADDQRLADALHHHGPPARDALVLDGAVHQQSHCMSHPRGRSALRSAAEDRVERLESVLTAAPCPGRHRSCRAKAAISIQRLGLSVFQTLVDDRPDFLVILARRLGPSVRPAFPSDRLTCLVPGRISPSRR